MVLLGQSLGGSLALDCLTRECPHPDRIVTVSAPTEVKLGGSMVSELAAFFRPSIYRALAYRGPYRALPAFGPFKRGRFPVRVGDGENYIDALTRAVAEMDLPDKLEGAAPCGVMIVHGARDGVIPVAQARQLAGALGDTTRLHIALGATHLDPLLNRTIVDEILDFTSSNIVPGERS